MVKRLSAHWPLYSVIVLSLLLFSQVTRFQFINFDDDQYVYANSVVRNGLSLSGFSWAFSQTTSGHWQPLTWLSHMVDCSLFGVNSPGAHHFVNVLLHALNVGLLFALLAAGTEAVKGVIELAKSGGFLH